MSAAVTPEIFISYARRDEPRAKRVADALMAQGYGVWRDDELPVHRAYSEVIEERLQAAGAVVVIWSAEGVKSQWVRAEADAAREKGTLVQVSVDGTVPPMPFNQIQCADLKGWDGDVSAPGWRKVEGSVTALLGPADGRANESRGRAPRDKVSVCVLPFANMSGDAEQEYFSDGISEDITTDLSNISALSVVARNTAFTFKGSAVDVADVARKLGVSHVLEGSVRKAGGRVRITAQLIDGSTGDHVWAERYDRDLTDIFAIQDEISKAIVSALKLKLLPEEKKAIEQRGTTNVDAYQLYLMARQTWVSGTHGDTRREETVIRMCDRILQMEPEYGRAWALKAQAQASLFFGYNQGSEDGVAAADRALELDPSVAEAYSVKAHAFAAKRRFAEAEKEIGSALQLAAESWDVNKEAAAIYIWQRKFSEAAPYYEKCVELVEDDWHSWEMLTMAYRALKNEAGIQRAAKMMLKSCETVIERDPGNCSAFGRGANALAILGDLERAKDWIDRALLIDPENLDIRYNFACTLLNLSGDPELAFEYLNYVFARSVGSIVRRADIDSDLDRIRDHPHFQEIYSAALERIAKLETETAGIAPATPPS